MKGALFDMGDEAGIADRNLLARVALKWNLSREQVTTVVVGADNPDQLANSIQALDEPELDEEERDLIQLIKMTSRYKVYAQQKQRQFCNA